MTKATHFPGLDALRAAAVITVVAFHTGHVAFPAAEWTAPIGGVAVEVFYALSGYLIGRILLAVVSQPTPATWLRFMARRWARTLPLYLVVLIAAVCLARPDADEIIKFAVMAQNLTGPISHTPLGALMGTSWSLTVEEVFYASFATSLIAAASVFGRRAIWPVILLFLVSPPILRAISYGQQEAYFAVLQNLDGIGWGVALAQLERQGSSLFRHPVACAIAGIMMVAAAWSPYIAGVVSQGAEWQPLTLTLAASGCALVVAAALRVRSLGTMATPVHAVASRCYSVYLTHWVLLTVASTLVDNGVVGMPVAIAGFLVATAAVSWATHRWVELPGMKLADLRVRRAAAAIA